MSIRRDPPGPADRDLARRTALAEAAGATLDFLDDPASYELQVTRFDHGSRVPGFREATDPTKDPAQVPDPAQVDVPADLRAEIEDYMSRYPDHKSAAIPALAAAQRLHGWCSPVAVEQVACVMRLTPGYLTAVATFYDMLETTPVGRKTVYVCTNISCSLRGADAVLARLREELGHDPDVNLRGFECLGACDIAPMASIDGVYVGPIDDEDIAVLAGQIREGADPLPAKQLVRRRVADSAANTDEVSRQSADAGTLDPVDLSGGQA
ncbi:MAG: NAD(P)H-dependent oxidoreductase subunit E [Patulibacter sp.]